MSTEAAVATAYPPWEDSWYDDLLAEEPVRAKTNHEIAACPSLGVAALAQGGA